MSSKVIRNALFNFTGFGVNAVIVFFLTPFIVHNLGNSAYGAWIIVVSLTGYLGLLDLGMRTTLPKYVAAYLAVNDYNGFNRFASTIFLITSILGVISFVLTILFAAFIYPYLQVEVSIQKSLPFLILITGINISFGFPLAVFQGVLLGSQRYRLVNIINVFGVVIRSILIYHFLKLKFGLITLGLITIITNLTVSLSFVFFAYFLERQLKIKISNFDLNELKKIFTFGLKSFIINMSDYMIYYSSTLLIGIFITSTAVTKYSIAQSLIVYLRQAILSLVTVLSPAASELEARKDIDGLHHLSIYSTKLVLLIIIPIGIGAVMLGKDFIRLWMGIGYDDSALILSILIIAQVLALSQYGSELILYGINKHKNLAVLMSSIAVVNVSLSIIFIHIWGLLGCAFGASIPLAFGQLIFVPIFIRKFINISIKQYIKLAIGPSILGGSIFFINIFILLKFWQIDSWEGLIKVILTSCIVYLLELYFLIFNYDEKQIIVKYISQCRPFKSKVFSSE